MIEKITKLCWNDFGWIKPSGSHGKSSAKKTHENSFGYGHEEWLLDKSKIINGYHYGFIQPLNLKSSLHIGKHYKLWLYSFTEKQKFIIGYINKIERISEEESIEVYRNYKRNGWLSEMVSDLEIAGINPKQFNKTPSTIFFNIKFKINDINLFDEYLRLSDKDTNIRISRYKLLRKDNDFVYKKYLGYKRKAIAETFVNPYHRLMQDILIKLLRKDQSYSLIKKEYEFVDVQGIFNKSETHYFEIKTDTPKNNIRQALGQLFEYAYFPNVNKADKLYIIGDKELGIEEVMYMKTLRKVTALNLYFRWIDMENEVLSVDF
jgi:hypothetical protein